MLLLVIPRDIFFAFVHICHRKCEWAMCFSVAFQNKWKKEFSIRNLVMFIFDVCRSDFTTPRWKD